MDGEQARVLTFDVNQIRHIDHGYAVTSHSSQGLTSERVLINMDTSMHANLINEVRKGTERIVEAGALASEIINRLRSLYKMASPKRELVAMNEVIGEMARMLGGQAKAHGVSIRTDLKDDLPITVADRVQLQQVLMNLMLNAIEAITDASGVITVKSQLSENGQIEISVNDTGPGLTSGKTDKIFDAFFTTKPQGSGMGLAISKSIVESHGGRIWANGNGGRGAAFHFTLPAAPAETTPPVDAA
jgi:signal transduction histidine kinase